MSKLPKRYDFSNHLPVPHEPAELPVQPQANQIESPAQAQQVIHIHHAPPDRTIQRLSLGAGMGAGTVAAAVYFGPILIAMVQSIVIGIISMTLGLAVAAWAIVTIVGAVSGPKGGRRR